MRLPQIPLPRTALSLLALGALLAACVSLRVGSDSDPNADFSRYHRVAWMQREHHRGGNPLVAQRARNAIQAELTLKGFEFVDETSAPDAMVDFTIGAQDRINVQSYPVPYRGPWHWGYPYYGQELDVRQYREGTLSIDLFDARTHEPVWHGWAKKELSAADMEHSEAPIREAVAAVLSRLKSK